MQTFETVVPAGKVTEAGLTALIEEVSKLTKAKITISSQFVIMTEDANISSMLDTLVEAIPDGESAARKNGKVKVTKKNAKGKSDGEMTSHQVRINATGEIVSTQAFNKQLKAGLIAELISITNAKGEEFVVMEGKLVKGPQS